MNIWREKGNPELGEAGESKISIFVQKGRPARGKVFVKVKGKVTKFRVLTVSRPESLLREGRTVRLRRGYNRL